SAVHKISSGTARSLPIPGSEGLSSGRGERCPPNKGVDAAIHTADAAVPQADHNAGNVKRRSPIGVAIHFRVGSDLENRSRSDNAGEAPALQTRSTGRISLGAISTAKSNHGLPGMFPVAVRP